MFTFVIGVYEAGVFRSDYTNKLVRYETVKARTPADAFSLIKDMYITYPIGNLSFTILRTDYKEAA
jgi:hypothetical protein